jgi:hypothetical protein
MRENGDTSRQKKPGIFPNFPKGGRAFSRVNGGRARDTDLYEGVGR